MIVIAEVGDADAASAAANAGVDALLHSEGSDGIAAVIEAAGDLPVGARLEAASAGDADALIEAGADFLVFDDAQTEAAALLRDELGHGRPARRRRRLGGGACGCSSRSIWTRY